MIDAWHSIALAYPGAPGASWHRKCHLESGKHLIPSCREIQIFPRDSRQLSWHHCDYWSFMEFLQDMSGNLLQCAPGNSYTTLQCAHQTILSMAPPVGLGTASRDNIMHQTRSKMIQNVTIQNLTFYVACYSVFHLCNGPSDPKSIPTIVLWSPIASCLPPKPALLQCSTAIKGRT